MKPENPLSQLRDIQLPQTGGFWPPAPGWWVLVLIIITAIAVLLWLVYRRRQRNQWLRQAKAELIYLEHTASEDPQWFAQLNTLLKQAARARYPNEHPEALSGEHWEAWLLHHLPPGQSHTAQQPIVEALRTSAWLPRPAAEPAQALHFARTWLEAQKC